MELNYYMDNTCKEKRGSINLSKFVSLCPNAKVGSKDHGFAVETEERKYILRAPDAVTKNIWIAKLCQLCGQGKKRNGGSRDGGGGCVIMSAVAFLFPLGTE